MAKAAQKVRLKGSGCSTGLVASSRAHACSLWLQTTSLDERRAVLKQTLGSSVKLSILLIWQRGSPTPLCMRWLLLVHCDQMGYVWLVKNPVAQAPACLQWLQGTADMPHAWPHNMPTWTGVWQVPLTASHVSCFMFVLFYRPDLHPGTCPVPHTCPHDSSCFSLKSPLATKMTFALIQSRTVDLDLTKVTLYQLSYKGALLRCMCTCFRCTNSRLSRT